MNPVRGEAIAIAPPLPWRRALLWLVYLGPFFFASYGFANWVAAQRQVTDAVFFAWERQIPFLSWTVIPYWSIDLLYALSFFVCRDRAEVDRHGLRMLTAQIISVTCFLLFPLRFSFDRPATSGLSGALFDALLSFDRPYNQAPALHISLLVILWVRYAPLLRASWGWLGHLWFALIGVSVLTTYQHHFVDIPTGALVGFLCLWLWPDCGSSPLRGVSVTTDRRRQQLAARYALGAVVLAVVATLLGGAALWLLWGAVALTLVSFAYLALGSPAFQKFGARQSPAAAALFAPYTFGAWINSRLWTRRHPRADIIVDDVFIGRMPTASELSATRIATLVDLSAELPAPVGQWRHYGFPALDLVALTAPELRAAAECIEAARSRGEVLVCCALGYSRSAIAVAAWLLISGRAANIDAAIALVCARRRGVVLGSEHWQALAALSVATGKQTDTSTTIR